MQTDFHQPLPDWAKFRHPQIEGAVFTSRDLKNWLQHIPGLSVKKIGESYENRGIQQIGVGKGEIQVLLWSQMHGDEPTATMALVDLLLFLSSDEPIAHQINEKLSLKIIPMLNPDGAQRFSRRNAQLIDINRDFLREQTPEGRLLKQVFTKLKPDFCFNLHDQGSEWSAGTSGNPATLSFLAPAVDRDGSIPPNRLQAMQVIAAIYQDMHPLLPEHIARFDDTFEPRAFGDNFQKAGSATLLFEAGGAVNDFDKQLVRRHTFLSLISGLRAIAEGSWASFSSDDYYNIPENEKRHFSILIRNCRLGNPDKSFITDIGLMAERLVSEAKTSGFCYRITDIGDLSMFNGYEEYEAMQAELILIRQPEIDEPADFILRSGSEILLTLENGIRNDKKI